VGIEPTENEKGYCIVNIRVDNEVDIGLVIVISALSVDEEPG